MFHTIACPIMSEQIGLDRINESIIMGIYAGRKKTVATEPIYRLYCLHPRS